MVKQLRFLVLSFLTILTTATFAQKTVTIDFDNDYQTIFPTLAGVSSGSGDSYVADGDFTGVTLSSLIDGALMVTVAPDDEASTPSRIWNTSPRLRMYSGTFSLVSMSLPITKIEFDAHDKNFNLTALEGTLSEDRVWTGSSQAPIFMVSKNTQIRKIVVTLGGEGENPGGDDPSGDDGLLSKFKFTSGSFTEGDNQLTFDFTGVGVYQEQNVDVTGNFVFDLDENQICTKTTANITFPSAVIANLAYLDTQANSEDYESVSLDGATLTVVPKESFNGYSKIVLKSTFKMILDNEQVGLGILSSPMTPNQANILAGTLEKDDVDENGVSKEAFYVKGKIAYIKYEFSANYGTATFFISADGQNDFTFQCYSVYYLENKPWVEGNTQIKVGDEVVICGKMINYKGNTPETASKQAYIYSLNGKTKEEGGNDNPDPQPSVTPATCAEVLAGTDGTVYRVTGKCVEIANTVYGNWYLEDATGKIYIYGTLDKDGNAGKNNSIDVWGIEVGDELTVEGERTTYKETVELKNVKVIEIKKGAAEGSQVWDFTKWSAATIANLKADAAASKTEGWSDVEKKADAEAGADPTEASKDNCFWSVAEPNADGELAANGVVIEELKGLVWNKTYSTARSLAIAVNYPTTSLGDYAGGAYLWLGGGKKKVPCFIIPDVKAGSTITMEVESHKPAEGRGVELYTGVDADNLVDAATKIGDTFAPMTKESHSWTIENDANVIVYNTNGCHIYKIEVAAGAAGIQVVKAVKVGNDFIYNLAGQRVDANYKGVVIKNGQKMIQK